VAVQRFNDVFLHNEDDQPECVNVILLRTFFTVRRHATAVYAVVVCLSVCLLQVG